MGGPSISLRRTKQVRREIAHVANNVAHVANNVASLVRSRHMYVRVLYELTLRREQVWKASAQILETMRLDSLIN